MSAAAAASSATGPPRTAAAARRRLAGDVIAGPLFVGATTAQTATREGFDPVAHPLRPMSVGDLGRVQIASFIASGLSALIGAVGLRRAPVRLRAAAISLQVPRTAR